MNNSRIQKCLAEKKEKSTSAFIPFITAGFPDEKTFTSIFEQLPHWGADLIEIGMPFSDPVADGPIIQQASQESLENGMTVKKLLDLVTNFRSKNSTTPVIMMGYYNPILQYGLTEFLKDAEKAGIDGLIIVDLPPEEEGDFLKNAQNHSVDLIHLIAPTTSDKRIEMIAQKSQGFLYYVSVKGITGSQSADTVQLKDKTRILQKLTNLPVAIGFGIKTPEQASQISEFADAVVVGSSLLEKIYKLREEKKNDIVPELSEWVKSFSAQMNNNLGI